MTAPERWFPDLLASQPGAPFVTYYDEGTGERSELSTRSLANWVAKTHFLLVDELGLGPGDTALLALPAHWISVPVVLGCLTAGLEIRTRAASSLAPPAAVGFVVPGTVPAAAGIDDVYVIDPLSAAQGFGGGEPAGTTDYVAAVRPQADSWASVRLVAGPDDRGLDGLSRAELGERARARAGELGLAAGGRLLSTRPWRDGHDIADSVFVPLAVQGSVVLVTGADEATAARRMQQERASTRI